MKFLINFHTDIGTGRAINEDSFAVLKATAGGHRAAVLAVCDGMGGLSRGELASKEVACAFSHWFEWGLPGLLNGEFSPEKLFYDWGIMIERVNRQIMEFGKRNGMELGTTLTAVLLWKGRYYGVHVGDCRLYSIRDNCRQLTRDQTLAAYRKSQGRNAGDTDHILMQCIGASSRVHPEFLQGAIEKNTVYLLCTDGFRRRLLEEELKKVLGPECIDSERRLKDRLTELIARVKTRGETDNMTAVSVKVC